MRQIARKWELFVSGAEVDLTDLSPVIRKPGSGPEKRELIRPCLMLPCKRFRAIRRSCDRKSTGCPVQIESSLYCVTSSRNPIRLFIWWTIKAGFLPFVVDGKAMANAEKIYAIPGGEWSEEKSAVEL